METTRSNNTNNNELKTDRLYSVAEDYGLSETEIASIVQKSLLELIDGFYFVLNNDFTFRYISQSIQEKTDYTPENLIGESFDKILSQESARQIHTLLSLEQTQGLIPGKYKKLEIEVITLKKEQVWFQLSLMGMINNEFYIGVCYDVNEIKAREKELIQAKETAEYNDKLKSEFLANMSHEIRTPLNGIVGFTTMLDRADLTDDKRDKYMRIIHSSTHHLLTLVNDIIDISKIEAGQLKCVNSKVDVHLLLDDLLATFIAEAKRLGKHSIRLVKQVEKPGLKIFIYCDEMRLKQVMNNLLGNALKFTTLGDIRFGYNLVNETTIRFFVKDCGIGLSKSAQKVIFKRFRQTREGEKEIYKGNGLGLAISKGIIELMGGKINVISEPGEGAEFFFTLPFNAKE